MLSAVVQPIDWTLLVSLIMILDEIVQEVIADDLTAGVALVTKGVCDEVKVFLQSVAAIDGTDKLHQATYDVIFKVFLIGDGDAVILIRGGNL